MTHDSRKLAEGLKEKVIGNVEKEAGKRLGSEHLTEKGMTQHVHGDRKLEDVREGIEEMKLQGTHQHHGHHEHRHEHGTKPKKHKKHKETHYTGEERLRTGTSTTARVADVVTTTGEAIRGETKVYEHVHPVTVVENTREITREEKPTQTTVHVVKHIEPIKETEVHRHIEPVEVVHHKEVVHPKQEVYVHEHVHPVEVTEIHEHIKPEVHSLERHDVYPEAVVREKHEQVLAGEVSRAAVHKEVDVGARDLDVDIKTGGMREKHTVIDEGVIKPTAIHHEKHHHHEGEKHHYHEGEKHHHHEGEKHHHHEGEAHGMKKGKKKQHHSDTGKTTKPSDTAPKV